jgi:streptomycin 6-kinase
MQDPDQSKHDINDMIERAQAYADAWNLSDPLQLAHTTMGLVQRVTCADGTFAVLKCLSEVGKRDEGTAPPVLSAFAGSGAVRLIRADEGAHLLEYCIGPQLLQWKDGHRDDIAIPILAEVVAHLRLKGKEQPFGVPTLAERCGAIDRALNVSSGTEAILFRKAREIADALLNDETPTLLHGDFHHENVLRSNRPNGFSWLAIDPQGVWGDPAYELANLFGNPRDHPEITLSKDRPAHLAAMLERALGLPAKRILGWAYVHSCISAAWSIEDDLDPGYRLRVAEQISAALI